LRSAWKEAPETAESPGPRPDDDRGWWRTLVFRVLAETGAPRSFDRDAYFAELYDEFTQPGVWKLYPEVLEVLETLAPSYRLGVISNFDGRLRKILATLGLSNFFEVVTVSSEVGAEKPDPWIYQRALELTGVDPGAALHVGDDPECDWQGAETAGLAAFKLDRPRNDLRELLRLLTPDEAE
jgi:putative hydrolase of the HAD superfamily